MTPRAETLDLSNAEYSPETVAELCNFIKECSAMIAGTAPEADANLIRLVADEFLKNVLHGDCAVVRMIPLPDGSFLLTSEDIVGNDHIPEDMNCHVGTVIIVTLAGEENYQIQMDGDHVHGFLRLDPHAISAT